MYYIGHMKIRWLLLFIVALYVPQNGKGQELISFEEQLFFTKEIIQQNLGFPAYYDVQLFKIIYTTQHVFMEPDTASGIIAVPLDSGYQFPILIYDHGTVASRKNVPSMGSYESLFAVAIAGQGYNCVAPDYIGLGISEGLHPYLHSESEARAGMPTNNGNM